MTRGYVVVEGQGEVSAVPNLLVRLSHELGLPPLAWGQPLRHQNLIRRRDELVRIASYVRAKPDVAALLVLQDDEDGCPRDDAPPCATWLRDLKLPFPAAIVLPYREYESLFLPCIAEMAGKGLRDDLSGKERPGLRVDARFTGDAEGVRGVKELLSSLMPVGQSYKPTVDQLPLTRMVSFESVRASGLPWFGSLERALRFLATNLGGANAVYPTSPADE